MENLGNGTISIGCSRGKEEKRKRRRVPVDITLARRRDVLQPRRGAHAGFIGRRERERERGRRIYAEIRWQVVLLAMKNQISLSFFLHCSLFKRKSEEVEIWKDYEQACS